MLGTGGELFLGLGETGDQHSPHLLRARPGGGLSLVPIMCGMFLKMKKMQYTISSFLYWIREIFI